MPRVKGAPVYTNDLSGPVAVNQCTFTGNYTSTGSGGAIYAGYENTPYNITAIASNFYANVSGGDGGAISATTARKRLWRLIPANFKATTRQPVVAERAARSTPRIN